MLFPEGVAIDGRTGAVAPETGRYVKRLSELRGIYQDEAAFERTVADGDPIAYEVIDYRKKESDLAFGTTIMMPGKIGGEYFMTRGHYHERPECGEAYYTQSGEGLLLLEFATGETRTVEMKPGICAFIPPDWAHRSINTGTEKLVFVWFCATDAGHDYGEILTRGMRKVVVEHDGKHAVIDNPGLRDGVGLTHPMQRETTSGRIDAAVLGELVIDLIPVAGTDGPALYAASPGGAPGNVAAGLARLGVHCAMLSKVGPGAFGDLLIRTLVEAGVDPRGIMRAVTEPTALAMVTLAANGEREFMLYREGCADANLAAEELPVEIVRACRVLHVGSLSLATPVSAAAQRCAVAVVRERGGWISADVNFRPAIWRDLDAMRATGIEATRHADILKVSTEELATLTGLAGIRAGAEAIWHPRLQLLAVTRGADGAVLFTDEHSAEIPGYPVRVVDTVGCGDAFMAALLAELLRHDAMPSSEQELNDIGRFACAAGAVVAGVSGAMAVMPLRQQIDVLAGTKEALSVTG